MTGLLTVAALTLQEAKASGGDAVRYAGIGMDAPAEARTFDVFQGLILAVDTKDRYTKRHSEDVARYGVFLARQLGSSPELIATIRIAGLLHDVGKIGIPDQILRKPGRLTEDEYAIVKQHVALGDLIVRDLPDIELIRAGVRHHHERWDGDGYLDRLAGEEIPLIARILAVGDAFSAMTTTRPYRKALDDPRGPDPARGRRRDAARRAARDGLRDGHRDRRRRAAAGHRGPEPRALDPVSPRGLTCAAWSPARCSWWPACSSLFPAVAGAAATTWRITRSPGLDDRGRADAGHGHLLEPGRPERRRRPRLRLAGHPELVRRRVGDRDRRAERDRLVGLDHAATRRS